jgi:hypothetical protein
VSLKGGDLKVPLGPWAGKDEVFAVAEIHGTRSCRKDWTLLQVVQEPSGPVCSCRLLHRRANPLPRATGVLGYRCLKLGTGEAQLRFRVVDERTGLPLERGVLVSGQGFQDQTPERKSTKDGLAKSDQRYRNVAFVSITTGMTTVANVPVEIIVDPASADSAVKWTPLIICPVSDRPEDDQRGQLIAQRNRWIRRVYESVEVSQTIFNVINALVDKSVEKALEKAQSSARELSDEVAGLAAEREALVKSAKLIPNGDALLDLSDADKHIDDLKQHQRALQEHIGKLSELVKKENDPKVQKWRQEIAKAQGKESALEFGEAINIYEKVIAEGAEDAKVKEHLDDLKKIWEEKSEEHKKARKFIYETWPKLENAAATKEQLQAARQAFETCRDAGDYLTTQKFRMENLKLANRLKKETESLKPAEKEEDAKTAKIIEQLTKDLAALDEEARQYLLKAIPKSK